MCGLLAAACGGTDHEAHARSLYNAYRTAEDARTDAEEELRLAFRDIAAAAQAQDRDAVLGAAQRGQDAVEKINDLIAAELEHCFAILRLRRSRDVGEGETEILLGIRPRVLGRAVGVVEGPRVRLVVGTAARGRQEPAGEDYKCRERGNFRLHGDRGYRSTRCRASGIMSS